MSLLKKIRSIAGWLFGLALLFPAVNGITGVYKEKGLDGAVQLAEDVSFSWKGWWDGTWQEKKQLFLNDHFGFRPFFIRLKHEIDFRLFRKVHANTVIIGKDNYLFEDGYIHSYYGRNFVGMDEIEKSVHKLKTVDSVFSKMGKVFVTIIAPGKASFYPEYIPDSMKTVYNSRTNYTAFRDEAMRQGVNLIDFSTYFRSLKNKTPYCLYPKNGVHWSKYAIQLAADSMIKYIEKRSGVRMAHYRWKDVKVEKEKEEDYDIARGMNLLFKLSGPDMGYPETETDTTGVSSKLSSAIIADSFYWGIYNIGFSYLFSSSQFWFYNHEVYPDYNTSQLLGDQVPIADVIRDRDVIILLATEPNIHSIGWGFIDRVYEEVTRNN